MEDAATTNHATTTLDSPCWPTFFDSCHAPSETNDWYCSDRPVSNRLGHPRPAGIPGVAFFSPFPAPSFHSGTCWPPVRRLAFPARLSAWPLLAANSFRAPAVGTPLLPVALAPPPVPLLWTGLARICARFVAATSLRGSPPTGVVLGPHESSRLPLVFACPSRPWPFLFFAVLAWPLHFSIDLLWHRTCLNVLNPRLGVALLFEWPCREEKQSKVEVVHWVALAVERGNVEWCAISFLASGL